MERASSYLRLAISGAVNHHCYIKIFHREHSVKNIHWKINYSQLMLDADYFMATMESIDSKLREAGIPVHSRALDAIAMLSVTLGGMDIFLNDELAQNVNAWYKNKYGDKTKLNMSIGSTIVTAQEEHYKVNFPFILGSVKINFFEFIEDITQYTILKITNQEADRIINTITSQYKCFLNIESLPKETIADLKIAIDNIFRRHPHYGLSIWASLQATEKCIKHYLKSKGIAPPKSHNLIQLFKIAEKHGLTQPPKSDIEKVTCSPSVRYDETVSQDRAIVAYHKSVELCAHIGKSLKTG